MSTSHEVGIIVYANKVSQLWPVGLTSQLTCIPEKNIAGRDCTKLTLPLLFKTHGVQHVSKHKAAQGSRNKVICCLVKNHGIEKKNSDRLSLCNFLLSTHAQVGYTKNYTIELIISGVQIDVQQSVNEMKNTLIF